MARNAHVLSIYASDTSGVCSALYELGGLVVVHDASGCNSTYSTHDEPRWYRQDSMIYISALTEKDAILGNDGKFIDDVTKAALDLSPAFIAICGSPMPMMAGTDFDALSVEIEVRTKIPTLGLHTNGINTYINGASQAWLALARRFCGPAGRRRGVVNIIGATPLDFALNGTVESMGAWLACGGLELNACFAMNCPLEQLRQASAADVNLVVSSSGMALAKYFQEHDGIPYVVGAPLGGYAGTLLGRLKGKMSDSADANMPSGRIAVIGESVSAASLAEAMTLECGERPTVLCPLDAFTECLPEKAIVIKDEDDAIRAFATFEVIVGDPLYKPIVPQGAVFIPWPHEAFSGRCYARSIPNLVDRPLPKELLPC